ncbi:MAG: hypothetical protein EXS35_03435 [Pedosphaera sp.]|nr:hypothetical protein [Pedosphaera sp.]
MHKTLPILITLALCCAARAQDQLPALPEPASDNVADSPAPQNAGGETNTDITAEQQQAVGELIQSVLEASQSLNAEKPADGEKGKPADTKSQRAIRGQGTRGTAGSGTNVVSLTALVARNSTNHTAGTSNLLRLNFRNAPLSMVLDYLSDAAGFTISPNSKVDLKGTVTVWSNQPVSRDQAVAVLNKALGEYHYAATVEGKILNIYVVDSSNTEIVSGVDANDYTKVPPTQELITQIVYVHNVESGQLITSLQPLMPNGTSMNANQGANAIVITDTKANIRRMVQLVKSLDTASVSASTVRVFALTNADATAMAQVVMQLFQADSSQSGRSRSGFGGFPGFGGFGGFGGGGGGDQGGRGGSSSSQAGRMSSAKVVAVADDRSNSLVVSASDEQMVEVAKLVKDMDVDVNEITEMRVFRLHYADPQETADQLAALFPDTTQQNANNRSGSSSPFRSFFGGFGSSRGGSSGSATADPISRKLRQARVTAVPDPRTSSVIVSASRETMGQIASIIEGLDSDPAKKKKVYVIKVETRDPQEVMEALQSVIAADTSGGSFSSSRSSNSRQTGSQLNTRGQNNLQNQGSSSGGFGSSSGSSSTGGSRTGR